MSAPWSSEQVNHLAPDASSRAAAARLAVPPSWTGAGTCGDLLWGLCAGSGKNPYQTVVDLSGPAYKCSCPSRKFPCKHALALLLLWSGGQVAAAAEPVDYAAAWKASRDGRAAAATRPRGERDEASAARRAEARADRVSGGLAELELWLADQVRAGLSGAASSRYGHADAVAARMVDAQAPGVAAALRRVSTIPATGDGWPGRLLAEYGQLHLLARAHARLDDLDAPLAAVVRSRVGYTVAKDDVLTTPPVHDRWQVLAVRTVADATIAARRTWLRGVDTARDALLLTFAVNGSFASAGPEALLAPGLELESDLHFYPGRPALRALLGGEPATAIPSGVPVASDIGDALERFTAGLEGDPWLAELPAVLAGTPLEGDDGWRFADPAGAEVPLLGSGIDVWTLAAVSGGRPVTVAGEWSPAGFLPLTVWHDGAAVLL